MVTKVNFLPKSITTPFAPKSTGIMQKGNQVKNISRENGSVAHANEGLKKALKAALAVAMLALTLVVLTGAIASIVCGALYGNVTMIVSGSLLLTILTLSIAKSYILRKTEGET